MSKRILSRSTPRRSAIMFMEQERPHIINQQEDWLAWDGHSYVPVETATIESEIALFLDNSFEKTVNKDTGAKIIKAFNPRTGDVAQVRDALQKKVHKPAGAFTAPCWLNELDMIPKASNVISVQNGLLDFSTRKLYDATPDFFNRTTLSLAYDPDAPKPERWLKFLEQVLPDLAVAAYLQELFGYTLSGDTSQHIIPFLCGVPRGGKGTILRILTDLVGPDNVAAPSIMELAGRFGLESCLGKSLVTVTDMNVDDKRQCGEAAVIFNKISGEDRVSVERKNKTAWAGRLPARFWLAGNNLPDFGSNMEAFAARLAMLPFEVSFLGREDRTLTTSDGTGTLQQELPGILNWSLDGLARLRERGKFEEPKASADAKLKMVHKSDPVRGFIEGRCVLDPKHSTDKDMLQSRYEAYCYSVGVHPLAANKFADKLTTDYPAIRPGKRSAKDGSRPPVFKGVRFNDAELPNVYALDPDCEAMGIVTGFEALAWVNGELVPKEVAEDFAE